MPHLTVRLVFLCLFLVTGSASAVSGELVVAAVGTEGSPHHPHGASLATVVAAEAEAINRHGGVLGHRVRVVGMTEDCSPGRASLVADEVVRLAPAVVIGHLCTSAAMTAAKVYAPASLLFIAPGVRQPSFNAQPAAAHVFRLAGRDDRFAPETADFVVTRFSGATAAVVSDRTRQGKGLAAALTQALRLRHVGIALHEEIESGERSYAALAERVRASGAGVILMPAQPKELAVLMADLRSAGVEAPVIGSQILAVPSIEPLANREGRRLILMLPWTGLERGAHGDAEFERAAFVARARAALQAWAASVTQAGSSAAVDVAKAMRVNEAQTAVGPLRFDEAGDARIVAFAPHVWSGIGWVNLKRQPPD